MPLITYWAGQMLELKMKKIIKILKMPEKN